MTATPTLFSTRLLLKNGKVAEAIALLDTIVSANANDHAAWYQLAIAESQRRQFFPALRAIKRALALVPEVVNYQRFKGLTLANMGACEEAIADLAPFVRAHPDDYLALHALQIAYSKSGKITYAIALGRNILKLEDRLAVPQPMPAQKGLSTVRGTRRVISFCLWGPNPVYAAGAMINARLASYMYPGWKCRFYLGRDVPAGVAENLKAAGAEVIDAATHYPAVSPSMWRFLVADDPKVSVFVCRDCDSRISPKDAAAVDAWLRSGKRAHVMRDHVLHRNLMLAGMWGARNDKPLHMAARIKRFSPAGVDARYGADQRFLAKEIWAEIRDDCLIHDSYYSLFGAQPFPVMGKGNDRFHVGMGITGTTQLQREAQSLGIRWPLGQPVQVANAGLPKQ